MVMTRADEGVAPTGSAGPAAGAGRWRARLASPAPAPWSAGCWSRWPGWGRSCPGSRRRARPTAPTRWPARTWTPASRSPRTPSASSRSTCRRAWPRPRSTRRPTSRAACSWRRSAPGELLQLGAVSDQVGGEPVGRGVDHARPRPRRRRPPAPRRHGGRVRHRRRRHHRGRHRAAGRRRHRGRRVVRRRRRAHGHPGAAPIGRRRTPIIQAAREGQVTLVRTTHAPPGRRADAARRAGAGPAPARRRARDPAGRLTVTERYVVLGLARGAGRLVRRRWPAGPRRPRCPVDFVKVVSREEARARLRSGRPFSALRGRRRAGGARPRPGRRWRRRTDARSWPSTTGALPGPGATSASTRCCRPGSGASDLLDALRAVARPIGRGDELAAAHARGAARGRRRPGAGRLVAVTGAGGVGRSTLAMALAAGLAADPRDRGLVVLADLALHAHQALLHDAGDVVPGAARAGRGPPGRGAAAPTRCGACASRCATRGYDLLLGPAPPPRLDGAAAPGPRRRARRPAPRLPAGGGRRRRRRRGRATSAGRPTSRTATCWPARRSADADLVLVVGVPGVAGAPLPAAGGRATCSSSASTAAGSCPSSTGRPARPGCGPRSAAALAPAARPPPTRAWRWRRRRCSCPSGAGSPRCCATRPAACPAGPAADRRRAGAARPRPPRGAAPRPACPEPVPVVPGLARQLGRRRGRPVTPPGALSAHDRRRRRSNCGSVTGE